MGHNDKRRWPVTATVLMTLVVVGSAAGCGDAAGPGAAGTTGRASTPVATTQPATSSPSSDAGSTTTSSSGGSAPVYWLGESRRSVALYREFRQVEAAGGPIASAVAAMTRLRPLDPDYLTPWRPATRVTATQTGTAVVVDLSRDAFANPQVGSELADRAIQQLVYTATAAAQQAGTPATSVRILVDGAAFDAWGAIRLGEPMKRAPMAAVQAHTWVTSPQEGAALPAGTVAFTGFGTSFEATFGWEVRNGSGVVVAKGTAMGGTGDGTFGEFTFAAELTPGSYTVKVSGDDPSGGAEGPGAATDDKAFTVR